MLDDIRGHSCREKQGLTLHGQLGDYLLDIVNKPHIQHPICLVQHEIFDIRKRDKTLRHQV